MSSNRSFKNLILWQKAHVLVLEIYRITSTLPKSEQFGIINQIQRSSTSVPANIAEGYERISAKRKNKIFIYCKWLFRRNQIFFNSYSRFKIFTNRGNPRKSYRGFKNIKFIH